MPMYSGIIPVYNTENYLSACLDSVLAQETGADFEIILVDDGSPDGSGAICDEYAAKFSNVRVLHTENHGVSCARNLAVSVAKGTFILYLDSDDFWEKGLLKELDHLAESEPDVMVFSNVKLMEDGSRIAEERDKVIPSGQSGQEFLEEMFQNYAVPRFYSCCYAVRKDLLMQNGILFREDLKVSEDFDYVMRFLAVANRIVGTPMQPYVYRIHQGSATAKITEKKIMDNLTTKAHYFRRYCVAAMANLYADNALLVAGLSKKEASQVLPYLKENRDIWNYVSQPPLKLGRILVMFFGDYGGAVLYHMLRSIVHTLRNK